VRISGDRADYVCHEILRQKLRPRHAHFLPFYDTDGSILDTGVALFFPKPHSFTGEHVLELQCHGSPMLLDLLLRRITRLGIRIARPGEFSERAFLNGKIDLIQAEAIADLIESSTEAAARSAQRSLQGEFSALIHELRDTLVGIRSFLEAAIDFSDEEIDFLNESNTVQRLRALSTRLEEVLGSARKGSILREGLTVVIAGRPNVGKSSLLNRLAQKDLAIVTDIAGTTRDALREYIQVDGMPLHVVDTAGIRNSEDPIEREGIRRAHAAIASADLTLLISDDHANDADDHNLLAQLPPGIPLIKVYNKIDLSERSASIDENENCVTVHLSAKTGLGINLLQDYLKKFAGYENESTQILAARRRHVDALERAHAAVTTAIMHLKSGSGTELVAEELRMAQACIGEITGEFTTEDLLNRIFSSFCIGK
jgi:tRNA modification GTPase